MIPMRAQQARTDCLVSIEATALISKRLTLSPAAGADNDVLKLGDAYSFQLM
jgi:hypothetical protein